MSLWTGGPSPCCREINFRIRSQTAGEGEWSQYDRINPCIIAVAGLIPPYTECIRDSVDIVEPGGDKSDLEDRFIVEPYRPKSLVIFAGDLCGVPGQLHYVIQHYPLLLGDRRGSVIPPQGIDQIQI